MLMVACLEMTSGDSGVSSAGLSLARSCHQQMCMSVRCGWSSSMHQLMDSSLLPINLLHPLAVAGIDIPCFGNALRTSCKCICSVSRNKAVCDGEHAMAGYEPTSQYEGDTVPSCS